MQAFRHLAVVLVLSCSGIIGDPGVPLEMLPGPFDPRIAAFRCTPESGTATLTSVCTFSVVQPDQRSVRCSLSVSDGRAPPLDDAACSDPVSIIFDAPGSFTITLAARDDAGRSVRATRAVA